MKKQRGRPPVRPKPISAARPAAGRAPQSSAQPAPVQSKLPWWQVLRAWLFRPIALFYAIGLALLNLLQAVAPLWPGVAIATGANLDPSQQFGTAFLVTNSGKLPLHDLTFACALVGGSMRIGRLAMTDSLRPVPRLDPAEAASRNCFAVSEGIEGAVLRIQVRYHWPFINRTETKTAYFSTQQTSSGFVMTPEPTPPSEPPAIFPIGNL